MSYNALTALVLLLTVGCSGSGMPAAHYYVLRAPAGAGEAEGPGLDVGVRSFSVDPPYDQDRLVYRSSPDAIEVGFYAYHRWASPLGRQLSLALADGLRGTRGVASIEPARPATDYTARLDGRLLHLEEIDSASGHEVRLALELTLRGEDDTVLWSGVLRSSVVGVAEDVGEIAAMAQRALDDVVSQASDALAGALAP